MQNCGINGRQPRGGGGSNAKNDKDNSETKVLTDNTSGFSRKANKERQPPQIVAHKCNRSGIYSDIASCCSHSDAKVSCCQCRCIVYAVTDHGDGVSSGFNLLDNRKFVLWQALCFKIGAAEFGSDTVRNLISVAGEHSYPFYVEVWQALY